MGEIKSTLDLVMERTRNLSMSAEERTRQRETDFEKRLQGLLNKYADEVLPIDSLMARVKELKAELKITDRQLVVKAVFGRIDPDADNKAWMDLIAVLEPSVLDSVEKILADYRRHQTKLVEAGELQVLDRLACQHGIKGSAVIPNPAKDVQYQERVALLKDETLSQIEALSGKSA